MTIKIKFDGKMWEWRRKGDQGVPSMWSRKERGGVTLYRRGRTSGPEGGWGIPVGPVYDNWGAMQDAEDLEFPLFEAAWTAEQLVTKLREHSYGIMHHQHPEKMREMVKWMLRDIERKIDEALSKAPGR